MKSLAKLREAAEASPGNAFFATNWDGKGYPLIGMSGKEGHGLEVGDLETEELLYDALREILEIYAERTGKQVDCIGQAAWWSSKIFRGEDVRVMMYPDEGYVALDVDNVEAIPQVEVALGLQPGQLEDLFNSAPTLSRQGHKGLHGHHYFKAKVSHARTLMNLGLGDVISVGSKYQVVYGKHHTGQSYEVYNSEGQVATLSVINEAPEFPTWLLDKLGQVDQSVSFDFDYTDQTTEAKGYDDTEVDDEWEPAVQWYHEELLDDDEFFFIGDLKA